MPHRRSFARQASLRRAITGGRGDAARPEVDGRRIGARAGGIIAGAAALAAADFAFKVAVATPSLFLHERSPAWTALSGALLVACIATVRIDSTLLSVAAGVTAGGVVGNAISWLVHDGNVPNPLFADIGAGIAFNLADVFVVAGLVGQAAALAECLARRRRGPRPRGNFGEATPAHGEARPLRVFGSADLSHRPSGLREPRVGLPSDGRFS
jgi:hypothetical protein